MTAETVVELKAIIAMMSDTGIGADRATVEGLAYAAEVLNPSDLKAAAAGLNHAADVLPGVVGRVENAVAQMSQFMSTLRVHRRGQTQPGLRTRAAELPPFSGHLG